MVSLTQSEIEEKYPVTDADVYALYSDEVQKADERKGVKGGISARNKQVYAKHPERFFAKFPRVQANLKKMKEAIRLSRIEAQGGVQVTGRSAVSEWQVIYGRARVGGTFTFMHEVVNHEALHTVVTFACHECVFLENLYLDGEQVYFGDTPDARWSTELIKKDGTRIPARHKIFMSPTLGEATGASNQVANADLKTQLPDYWTTEHRQRGCAYVYILFVWDALIFPNGLPEIEILTKGKSCYDPRTDSYLWTDNPALILADYMMDSRFGMGIPQSKIDMDKLAIAASRCDTVVTKLDGTTEKLFTFNGTFQASDSPESVLERIISHMSGNLVYANGKWKIYASYWSGDSGISLSEGDILSDIRITTNASRKDIFNAVRGTYLEPTAGYREVDFIPVRSAFYRAEDNGVEIYEDIQLPYCNSSAMAQRIAKLELAQIRAGLTCTFTASLKALKAEPADNIRIYNTKLGWDGKFFEVEETQIVLENDDEGSPFLAVQLTCRETAENVFDFSESETLADITPNTNLPDFNSVAPIKGLAISSGTDYLLRMSDGTIITRAKVAWNTINDFYVSSGGEIHVEFKELFADDSTYQEVTPVSGNVTFSYVSNLKDGQRYTFRVRSRNAAGIYSAYTYLDHTVVGKSQPPSDVRGFQAQLEAYGIRIKWTANNDPDISEYELRVADVGENWDTSEFLARTRATEFIAPLKLVGEYSFLIKAIDTSKNFSVNAGVIRFKIPVPLAPNVTLTLDRDTVIFKWDKPTSTFEIGEYELKGAITTEDKPRPDFNQSVVIATTRSTSIRLKVDWGGTKFFWVSAIDVAGNRGLPFEVAYTINFPGIPYNLRAVVIDNNVNLYWQENKTVLPIDKYSVYRQLDNDDNPSNNFFSQSTLIGDVSGTFFAFFEQVSGRYSYWVVSIDSAGNKSQPAFVSVKVDQPPDFIFKKNGTLDMRQAKIANNIFIEGFGFVSRSNQSQSFIEGTPIGLSLVFTKSLPIKSSVSKPSGTPLGLSLLLTYTNSSSVDSDGNTLFNNQKKFYVGYYSQYNYTHQQRIDMLKALSLTKFNLVVAEQYNTTLADFKLFIDQANAYGIKVMGKDFSNTYGSTTDPALINELKNLPGWQGFAFADDADVYYTPSAIQTRNNYVKANDGNHATYISVANVLTADEYLPYCDMIGIQSYFYNQPVSESIAGTYLKIKAVKDMPESAGKALIANLQMYKKPDSDVPGALFPSPEFVDYSSYQALMAGANGIIYYTFEADPYDSANLNTVDRAYTSAYSKTVQIATEINQYQDLLRGTRNTTIVDDPYGIISATWSVGNNLLIAVANPSSTSRSITCPLPVAGGAMTWTAVSLPDRANTLTVSGNTMIGTIAGKTTQVYTLTRS